MTQRYIDPWRQLEILMSTSDINVVLRRSGRRKRRVEDWRETLQMTIRASRASGDSDLIPVESVGGTPSHRSRSNDSDRNDSQSDEQRSTEGRMPYCSKCGHEHAADSNFCPRCGKPREPAPSKPREPAPSETTTSEETPACKRARVRPEITDTDSATNRADIVAMDSTTAGRGRPSKLEKLRCGWSKIGSTFVAPDGEKFQDRKQASKYFNKNVPKLEPARQDGWQVFVDATGTHVTWIAPDGQKLGSFISAKSYAKASSLPIFGKDGITKSIASFFTKSTITGKNKNINAVIDLTPRAKPNVDKSSAHVAHQDVKEAERVHHRKFTIPKQSMEAAQMQELMKLSAIFRNQRRYAKADRTEKQYNTLYTLPRKISSTMVNKVCPCTLSICPGLHFHFQLLTLIYFVHRLPRK